MKYPFSGKYAYAGWSLLEVMMVCVIGVGLLVVMGVHYRARIFQMQMIQSRLILFKKSLFLEHLIRSQLSSVSHFPCGDERSLIIYFPQSENINRNSFQGVSVQVTQGQTHLVIRHIVNIQAKLDTLSGLTRAHVHLIDSSDAKTSLFSEKQWLWLSDCEFGEWAQIKSIKKIKSGFSLEFQNALQHPFSKNTWIAPLNEVRLFLNQNQLYQQVNGGSRMNILQGLALFKIQFWVKSKGVIHSLDFHDIRAKDPILGIYLQYALEENQSTYGGVINAISS